MHLNIVMFFIGNLILALMFSVGLGAKPGDVSQIRREPALYLRALLVMEIAIPLLALVIVSGLGVPLLGSALILLMAICPGAPFIPFAAKHKGQKHSVHGLNLLVLTSLLAPLTIPAWVWLVDRFSPYDLHVSSGAVFVKVMQVVFAPLLAGVAIRQFLPNFADKLSRWVHYFFLAALTVTAVVAIYLGAPVLREAPFRTFAAVFLLTNGSALLGYWAGFRKAEASRATAIAAALGNPGLVLAVLAASYPGFKAAAFVFAYVIVRKLSLIPLDAWMKRRDRAQSPPAFDEHAGAHGAAR